MALTREEILRLIKEEENKIKEAEERKQSYQYVELQANGSQQVTVSQDEMQEEMLANKPQEKPLSKWFYIISILAGLLLVALIVLIILGIISGWTFKF